MSLTSFDIEPISLICELTAPINFRRVLPAHTLHSPLGAHRNSLNVGGAGVPPYAPIFRSDDDLNRRGFLISGNSS
jgi:hypothetical protein